MTEIYLRERPVPELPYTAFVKLMAINKESPTMSIYGILKEINGNGEFFSSEETVSSEVEFWLSFNDIPVNKADERRFYLSVVVNGVETIETTYLIRVTGEFYTYTTGDTSSTPTSPTSDINNLENILEEDNIECDSELEYKVGLAYDSFCNILNNTTTRRKVTKLSKTVSALSDMSVVLKVKELYLVCYNTDGTINEEEYDKNKEAIDDIILNELIEDYNKSLMEKVDISELSTSGGLDSSAETIDISSLPSGNFYTAREESINAITPIPDGYTLPTSIPVDANVIGFQYDRIAWVDSDSITHYTLIEE